MPGPDGRLLWAAALLLLEVAAVEKEPGKGATVALGAALRTRLSCCWFDECRDGHNAADQGR